MRVHSRFEAGKIFQFSFITLVCLLASIAGCGPTRGCPEPGLEHTNLDDLECEFTAGRRAYAKNDYEKAAKIWERVTNRKTVTKREEVLFAMAHGTLGFLFYNGLGVQKDKQKALELYKTAVSHGDTESRNHLGDAYLDKENAFYDPVTAYAWYASVERQKHEPLSGYEDVEKEVILRAQENAASLKSSFTNAQLARAEKLLVELR